jgi:hypothetical protein
MRKGDRRLESTGIRQAQDNNTHIVALDNTQLNQPPEFLYFLKIHDLYDFSQTITTLGLPQNKSNTMPVV